MSNGNNNNSDAETRHHNHTDDAFGNQAEWGQPSNSDQVHIAIGAETALYSTQSHTSFGVYDSATGDEYYQHAEEVDENYVNHFPEEETDVQYIVRKVYELRQAIEAKYPGDACESNNNITTAYINFRAVGLTAEETDFQYLDDDVVPPTGDDSTSESTTLASTTGVHSDESTSTPIVIGITGTNNNLLRSKILLRESRDAAFAPVLYQELFDNVDYYARSECCVKLDENAFLVSGRLDYIYGLVLETALLENTHPDIYARSFDAFQRRSACMDVCHADHVTDNDTRRCSRDWVIYTRLDSSFARHCIQSLERSLWLTYSQQSPFSPIQRDYISFYLVLFLCGEHLSGLYDTSAAGDSVGNPSGPTSTTTASSTADVDATELHPSVHKRLFYKDTNQWIRVPAIFAEIWSLSMEAQAK